MIETDKKNGFVELTVSDKANILHRVGSAEYPEIRRTTVRAEEASAWEECAPPDYQEGEYEARVEALIAERYSLTAEIAILRQRDSKPDEFAAYNAYAEQCKAQARLELTNQAGSSVTAVE